MQQDVPGWSCIFSAPGLEQYDYILIIFLLGEIIVAEDGVWMWSPYWMLLIVFTVLVAHSLCDIISISSAKGSLLSLNPLFSFHLTFQAWV